MLCTLGKEAAVVVPVGDRWCYSLIYIHWDTGCNICLGWIKRTSLYYLLPSGPGPGSRLTLPGLLLDGQNGGVGAELAVCMQEKLDS